MDFRFQDAFRLIYFAQITGSYTLAMAVFSLQWITSALADIPTGVLSDKMGRKFTIVLASVCSTAGITTWAFSKHSTGLFVGSLFFGLFFAEPRVHMAEPQKSLRHLKDACIKIYGNTHLLLLVIAQAISRADDAKSQLQMIFINTLWPTWAVSVYKAMNNALGFFGFWFSGRIVDRFKETYVLAVQQAYWLVSETIGLILSNIISPLLFTSGSILFGPGIVARDHLLQKEFTDEQRATMDSVASFAGSIVYAIVALCTGIVADHFSLVAGVGFGVAIRVIALPLYVWLFRKDF